MHEHRVAHRYVIAHVVPVLLHKFIPRDCQRHNIMMDGSPLFPRFHHPIKNMRNFEFTSRAKYHQRTAHPVKYYLVDFGISQHYEPFDTPPLEDLILGGDRTLPEFRLKIYRCDPFATDIYYLGNLFASACIQVCSSLTTLI